MTLAPGSRVGPYEVLAPLGAGGMGEVFRARDTRLGREVAIKALPEAFARDAERLARLEREARLLASLSHPNLAGIHGLEIEDGRRYLVLELVEGESLAARIARGALPLDETLDVCRQIAAGLEAAHESGVVHRDLKPGNVMLTPAGEVKVLDFGLAKASAATATSSTDLSTSPTMTWAATSAGVILGTAAYMSPEQARGKAFDRRTDIWSFGCVLYECLTGRRAFEGETVSDLIAKILEREPDMSALPANTPPRLTALLVRCLRKDGKARLRDIGDARIELEEIAGGVGGVEPIAAPKRRLSPAAQIGLAVAGAILAAFAGVGAQRLLDRPEPVPPTHVQIALPDSLSLYGWGSPVISFSPDGRMMACAAIGPDRTSRVYLHDLGDGSTRVVPGSDDAEGPFFSPDGEWVAFAVSTSGGSGRPELRKHSLRTGLTQTVCAVRDYFGGFWEGAEIVWSDELPGPLMRVSAAGGAPRPLVETLRGDTIRAPAWPEPLPGGPWLLVTSWDEPVPTLGVIDRRSGECRDLGINASFARYVPGGLLCYVTQAGQAFVVPFDAKRGEVSGEAVAVRDGVTLSGNDAGVFAVAGGSALAWSEGWLRYSGLEEMRLVHKAPGREPEPLALGSFSGRYVRVSPDGSRAVVSDNIDGPWLVDLERGTRSRLVADMGYEWPVWNHDGTKILIERIGSTFDVLEIDAHPGAMPRRIGAFSEETYLFDVLADGSAYLSASAHDGVLRLHPFDGAPPREILPGRAAFSPRLSPDGRWLSYSSILGDQREVFVEAFGGGRRAQVSFGGGALSAWSRDGREIYFTNGDLLFAAPFTPGDPPVIGPQVRIDRDDDARHFDVLPGRREFLVLQRVPGAGYIRRVELLLGGVDELKALVEQRGR